MINILKFFFLLSFIVWGGYKMLPTTKELIYIYDKTGDYNKVINMLKDKNKLSKRDKKLYLEALYHTNNESFLDYFIHFNLDYSDKEIDRAIYFAEKNKKFNLAYNILYKINPNDKRLLYLAYKLKDNKKIKENILKLFKKTKNQDLLFQLYYISGETKLFNTDKMNNKQLLSYVNILIKQRNYRKTIATIRKYKLVNLLRNKKEFSWIFMREGSFDLYKKLNRNNIDLILELYLKESKFKKYVKENLKIWTKTKQTKYLQNAYLVYNIKNFKFNINEYIEEYIILIQSKTLYIDYISKLYNLNKKSKIIKFSEKCFIKSKNKFLKKYIIQTLIFYKDDKFLIKIANNYSDSYLLNYLTKSINKNNVKHFKKLILQNRYSKKKDLLFNYLYNHNRIYEAYNLYGKPNSLRMLDWYFSWTKNEEIYKKQSFNLYILSKVATKFNDIGLHLSIYNKNQNIPDTLKYLGLYNFWKDKKRSKKLLNKYYSFETRDIEVNFYLGLLNNDKKMLKMVINDKTVGFEFEKNRLLAREFLGENIYNSLKELVYKNKTENRIYFLLSYLIDRKKYNLAENIFKNNNLKDSDRKLKVKADILYGLGKISKAMDTYKTIENKTKSINLILGEYYYRIGKYASSNKYFSKTKPRDLYLRRLKDKANKKTRDSVNAFVGMEGEVLLSGVGYISNYGDHNSIKISIHNYDNYSSGRADYSYRNKFSIGMGENYYKISYKWDNFSARIKHNIDINFKETVKKKIFYTDSGVSIFGSNENNSFRFNADYYNYNDFNRQSYSLDLFHKINKNYYVSGNLRKELTSKDIYGYRNLLSSELIFGKEKIRNMRFSYNYYAGINYVDNFSFLAGFYLSYIEKNWSIEFRNSISEDIYAGKPLWYNMLNYYYYF